MKYKVNSYRHSATPGHHRLVDSIDWRQLPRVQIRVQIHQINWPPMDIFRWKLLK